MPDRETRTGIRQREDGESLHSEDSKSNRGDGESLHVCSFPRAEAWARQLPIRHPAEPTTGTAMQSPGPGRVILRPRQT